MREQARQERLAIEEAERRRRQQDIERRAYEERVKKMMEEKQRFLDEEAERARATQRELEERIKARKASEQQ